MCKILLAELAVTSSEKHKIILFILYRLNLWYFMAFLAILFRDASQEPSFFHYNFLSRKSSLLLQPISVAFLSWTYIQLLGRCRGSAYSKYSPRRFYILNFLFKNSESGPLEKQQTRVFVVSCCAKFSTVCISSYEDSMRMERPFCWSCCAISLGFKTDNVGTNLSLYNFDFAGNSQTSSADSNAKVALRWKFSEALVLQAGSKQAIILYAG